MHNQQISWNIFSTTICILLQESQPHVPIYDKYCATNFPRYCSAKNQLASLQNVHEQTWIEKTRKKKKAKRLNPSHPRFSLQIFTFLSPLSSTTTSSTSFLATSLLLTEANADNSDRFILNRRSLHKITQTRCISTTNCQIYIAWSKYYSHQRLKRRLRGHWEMPQRNREDKKKKNDRIFFRAVG